jgi:hypothetical protein
MQFLDRADLAGGQARLLQPVSDRLNLRTLENVKVGKLARPE